MAQRRNVIVNLATSADGYIARPDGDIEWLTSRPKPAGFCGVIDELVITVMPVFIGDGRPLIARRHLHVPLDLQSVDRFDDGVVQLRYRVQAAVR